MDTRTICIDERYFVIWDDNISDLNKKMVENIDCDYFHHQSNYVYELLQKDESSEFTRKIVINIFGHTLETFWGLLFSTIQAPHFYFGWLSNYRNYELNSILEKVDKKIYLPNKIKLGKISWDNIAQQLFPIGLENDAKEFGKYWKKMYQEYKGVQNIYNSIKHGLRIKTDGIKKLNIANIEFNNEDFENGFSSYRFEKIEKNSNNFSLYQSFYHYNIHRISCYIELAAISISNLKSYLITYNKMEKPKEFLFYILKKDWIDKLNNMDEPRIKGIERFDLGCEYLRCLPDKNVIKSFYNKD